MNPFIEYIDFSSTALTYRMTKGRRQPELLAKALGIGQGSSYTIIDATAGLGRDAFILASFGCKVTMVEKHAEVAKALQYALDHASDDAIETTKNLRLHIGDALEYLPAQRADMVYLDPMFAKRKKTALVKKDMQLLQAMVGQQEHEDKLLSVALGSAIYRVVVKRALRAKPIDGIKPNYTVSGKAHRFDVYVKRALPKAKETTDV